MIIFHAKKFDNVSFFPRVRIRASKEVKNIISYNVESFRYADGEIVGLVHAGRRERDGTYETCSLSHCVFSTAIN